MLLARQMMSIESKIFQIANRENNLLGGTVKIGSFPAASTMILSRAIALFKKKYPFVSIELIEGTSNEVKKWVEDRVVDFGIGISPFNGYEFKLLIQDKMVGITTKKHTSSEIINLKTQQDNLVFCKSGQETAISQTLKDYKIYFDKSFIVQNAETVISMVQNHVGMGVISEFVLSSIPHNLKICEIDPLIEMEIGLIAHSFDELTPVATEFVNVIKNYQFE
ncbi:LysR family transcriptional regulator substrate-binding protein [Priestia endophytica]|uniref:LysR family transcriptional regulator substrate-binding protein n=1 Tax=Priestia endophytica TaxID=135735 RepID=UPI00115AC44D|nr:LysR family transcriptional regulator substrate-binding protein [Priestia endophytica]